MKKSWLIVVLAILLVGLVAVAAFLYMGKQEETVEVHDVPHLALTVTEENFGELELYTALETLDLQDSTCYDLIMEYVLDHPEVAVTYRVDVGGIKLTNQDTGAELTAENFEFDLLLSGLEYLPELRFLSFPQTDLAPEQLETLQMEYPDITVAWTVLWQGQEISWDATALTVETDDAEDVLKILFANHSCAKEFKELNK